MRQQFNPENFNIWLDYYANQASQVGYGMPGFKGIPYQRGAGLGSFFRSLFRMAVPIIKSVAGKVGHEALSTGANIASDIVRGRPALEALEEHGRQGASKLLKEASEKVQKGRGLGRRPKDIKEITNDVFNKPKRTRKK